MRRLVVVRHAPTAATRSSTFPADEPLDARGRAAAAALARALPAGFELLSSPARACVQTIACAGLGAPTVDPALAECDFGSWSGTTLAALAAADPDAVGAWRSDPHAVPHGGESLAAVAARVARWLDDQAQRDGGAVAVTHATVVKAAVVCALRAPLTAVWQIDAAPLRLTELHARDGRWTLTRSNAAPVPTPAAAA